MSKPKVALENYKKVYDYYEKRRQNPGAARRRHTVLAKLFKPTIHTLNPDLDQQIMELRKRGAQFVIAGNHVSDVDPVIMASLTRHYPPLAHLEGNTFIPSKSVLFKHRVLRWLIDDLGATPQFRTKDVGRNGEPLPSKIKQLRNAARERSFSIARNKLEKYHQNMGIYPEGERNGEERDRISKIGFGLGEMICNLDPSMEIAIIPIGVHYGNERKRRLGSIPLLRTVERVWHEHDPDVTIGNIILGPFQQPADFEPLLQAGMQETLDHSIEQRAMRFAEAA
ncbi:1-acyl-sn-glycerol-3-phosphate acyltransferase [Candidatus Saccharibacteria bacterium]|nr:1-acyl-sn-glycerol-3-phosphate acyltransferase [Candidatus Saccharibacteria bacterium]